MIFRKVLFLAMLLLALSSAVWATVFSSLRGVVHDPDHRPVSGARVVLKSASSDYSATLTTDAAGAFETASVPVGAYTVTVTHDGFAPSAQAVVVSSTSSQVLHFQLALGVTQQAITVSESA